MTYNYKLENFISTPTNDDLTLIILDKNGDYVDSLTPDLSHYFVSNNCLIIKVTNKNDIILSFESKLVAQQALEKLNAFRYDVLKNSTPGISGESGTSGISGTSGSSGISGTSGTSGESGTSGISGTSGESGTSGISGTSGESGTSGISGASGESGSSGTSGESGTSGTTGTSGVDGTSGITGTDGTSGVSGTSGSSGVNGIDSSKPTQLTNIVLSASNWILNSETTLFEYSYLNSGITENTIIDIIPHIVSSTIVENALIYAMTTSVNGSVTIYSKNIPSGDILVTINVFYL